MLKQKGMKGITSWQRNIFLTFFNVSKKKKELKRLLLNQIPFAFHDFVPLSTNPHAYMKAAIGFFMEQGGAAGALGAQQASR